MAEIKIEKKKSVWPWIIGLLLLALIIGFFMFNTDDDVDEIRTEDQVETVEGYDNSEGMNSANDKNDSKYASGDRNDKGYTQTNDNASNNSSALQQYKTYIDNPNMGLDHEYSNQAIIALVEAVRETANKNDVNLNAELDKAKQYAEFIAKDPESKKHANKIKNSGLIIVNALETLQSQKFDGMNDEISEFKKTINSIEKDELTLNQKSEVKAYFNKAAEILTKMKNNEQQ